MAATAMIAVCAIFMCVISVMVVLFLVASSKKAKILGEPLAPRSDPNAPKKVVLTPAQASAKLRQPSQSQSQPDKQKQKTEPDKQKQKTEPEKQKQKTEPTKSNAKPAQKQQPPPKTQPTGNQLTAVSSYDTMTQDRVRQLMAQVNPRLSVSYSFVKGSDGLQYYVQSTAPAGWLECIVKMRVSFLPALKKIAVAGNGEISRLDDMRLSKNEFESIARVLNQKKVSAIASLDPADFGFSGACTAINAQQPICGGVCLVALPPKDFVSRGWKQECIHYLLHELSHAAMSGPAEDVAHNLEFFRIQHILVTAALTLGTSVYNPNWYNWSTTDPNVVYNLGSQLGTDEWWAIQKRILIQEGKRFTPDCVVGDDPVVDSNLTGVNITVRSPGS